MIELLKFIVALFLIILIVRASPILFDILDNIDSSSILNCEPIQEPKQEEDWINYTIQGLEVGKHH